ncbi:MAG TPA: prolipoprotein diacylglyceryl transferase [Symbiobacteriaceae bacterium]|jgi:phosphatidylglycerol:prolipoprotein diacylglycerol transferase
MHPYVFQTNFYSLRWENVAVITGIAAGLWLAYRRAAPKGRAYQDMLLDLALWLVLAGVAGARVWDVAFTWETYAANPWEALALWHGGMSIQGSVLGGLLAALLFARRRQLRVWELLDILAPGVILGQAIGRIGCLLNGDAFSRPIAEFPWLPTGLGVVYAPSTPAWHAFGATPLVPAEGFEMVADFLILAVLLLWRPRREATGRLVLTYGLLYSAARFGLEFFRADSLRLGGLKVAQLLSLSTIALCTVFLVIRYRGASSEQTNAAG